MRRSRNSTPSDIKRNNLSRRAEILGFPVTLADRQTIIEQIAGWIKSGEKCKTLVCLNPHSAVTAWEDSEFNKALNQADLALPDGVGVLIASRLLRKTVLQRFTGSDLFHGLSRRLNLQNGIRYFFLGATEDILNKIQTQMSLNYPNITVAGLYAPPLFHDFTEADNENIINSVNNARPHVLWVGFSAPKQEKWIMEHKGALNVNFIGAIGAVFNFFSGQERRAPAWLQQLGLEWFFRLANNPLRLWKRTFFSAPRFMFRVFGQKCFPTNTCNN